VKPSEVRVADGGQRRPSNTGAVYFDQTHGLWVARKWLGRGRFAKKYRRTKSLAFEALDAMFTSDVTVPIPIERPAGARDPRLEVRPKMRFTVLQRDGFRCRYCGATAQDARLDVDHVVSVRDGGTNTLENLVTACRECNIGKHGRSLSVSEIPA
jgi:hypothetical protein